MSSQAGGRSNDSYRGYRSLNNTGRVGIDQDNQLGRQRDNSPNEHDQNYSQGDYHVNLNAGGQEYNSRHYEQRGRMGTQINDYAQRGYSQGYGRTGYSLNQPGNYANGEVRSGRHPKNYKGADERIYVEVCEALGRELDASDIEVKSSGSEITLTGSVRSREEKRRAERIAERVHGVEDVHNQLTIKEENTSNSSGSSASSQSPQDRSATQPGNSSRTDLAADGSAAEGSSQTEGNSANGSSSSGASARTAGSNGSGRSGSRK
jgi:osmotically-inducible protein OsmY